VLFQPVIPIINIPLFVRAELVSSELSGESKGVCGEKENHTV